MARAQRRFATSRLLALLAATTLNLGAAGLSVHVVQAGSYSLGWAKVVPTTSPAARAWQPAMAYDTRQRKTVLFGGAGSDGTPLGDTWQWDGYNWTASNPAVSPSPREFTQMAFDSTRGVSVLFSGGDATGVVAADTWEWDGTSWTRRALPQAPPPRGGAAMTYDQARHVILLFGGNAGGFAGVENDTWSYDGTTWTRQQPVHSPPARWLASAAYNPLLGRTVLFGGSGSQGPMGDTWEWDGADWSQLSTCVSPSPRFGSAMAYDTLLGRVVLFGGKPAQAINDGETWEWDGQSWIQDAPGTSPAPRSTPAAAFDSDRGRLVMFGGDPGGPPYLGDTWEVVASASADDTPQVRLASSSVGATEGVGMGLAGSFSDPDSTAWSATVAFGDGVCREVQPAADGSFYLQHAYASAGSFTLIVSIRDESGQVGYASANVSVANPAPVVSPVIVSPQVVRVGGMIFASASFADAGVLDQHSGRFDWGNGGSDVASINEGGGRGTVSSSHVYASSGLYTVSVTVNDEDGAAGQASFQDAVVFDPSAGSVSGSGTFSSPAGAYPADPAPTGKVSFSLDVAYKSAGSAPSGSTSMNYQAGSLRIQAGSYDWLVVAANQFEYRGSASVNGVSGYELAVSGSAVPSNSGVDTVRFRIWDPATGRVVYDNQPGLGAFDYGTQAISSGNVSIHK